MSGSMTDRAPTACPAPPARRATWAAALACGLALAATGVDAQTPDGAGVIGGAILDGWQMADGRRMAGVALQLAPGWKTYWRSPGDAGIPPQFDWSGSRNLAGVEVHWPAPEVFHTNGMQSVGYTGDVVLPLEVVPADPGRPVALRLEMELGVCEDICVPATLLLEADLGPAAGDPQGQAGRAVSRGLAARPASGAAAGVGSVACEIAPIADGLRVTARMDLPRQGGAEVVVIEPGAPEIWVAESVVVRQGPTLQAVTEMVGPSGAPFALDRSAMRITVLGSGGAAEIVGCPAP